MSNRKIGDTLSRIFRDVCEENNNNKRLSGFKKLPPEEVEKISDLLKKIDNDRFSLTKELRKHFNLSE